MFRANLKTGESSSFLFCLHRSDEGHKVSKAVAESTLLSRKKEHDEYYNSLMSKGLTEEERAVFIQASAGLLFSKQFYYYDVDTWLNGDPSQPPPPPGLVLFVCVVL